MLQEILDEEKAANEKLTELARGGNNEEALGEANSDESSEDNGKMTEKLRHGKGRKLAEV